MRVLMGLKAGGAEFGVLAQAAACAARKTHPLVRRSGCAERLSSSGMASLYRASRATDRSSFSWVNSRV